MRALARAVHTADEIQRSARDRQRKQGDQPEGEHKNAVARLTTDLDGLYADFRADKRDIYATGLVPEGTDYRPRPRRAR